ncbi:MAG: aspartate kinase [Muribaculaceae bacterium]|nr:aspartate kinase [Muribaculaceae bacterium]MDE6796204.1 aspartate kinase [Muribaculaceae bacterium]
MKVMKFGGTSVGSAQRMKNVVGLVETAGNVTVVLSAMSGTTNSLINLSQCIKEGERANATKQIDDLEKKYKHTAYELLTDQETYKEAIAKLDVIFAELREYLAKPFGEKEEKEVVAYGEKLSTMLVALYMREKGLNSLLLDATEFMRLTPDGEPDQAYIKENLNKILLKYPDVDIFLTQGFICRNANGEIDNLQRGGSDYTASLIGAAVGAEEIQIWTDIDGMHNNDPRFVEGTSPVSELHFEEAAELAYFGAKILHPTCVLPAKYANIPVRLLNTMQPEAPGTVIFNTKPTQTIKAVAAKDNITAIKIKSSHMLLAYGFLRKVFEIFEKHQTPIDMITTSEVGVSVTIDNERCLEPILKELSEFSNVTVDRDMVIVCVVGDLEWQNRGFEAEVVNALREIPVRMISYGGSNYNISLLIRKADKIRALQLLSKHLF